MKKPKKLIAERPIELIARAMIIKDNKILLCQKKGSNFSFFPGGHVEFKETLKKALFRELEEELKVQKVKKSKFITALENFYTDERGTFHHELNFIFQVDCITSGKSAEDHLDFFWASLDDIKSKDVRPHNLINYIKKARL